MPTTPYLTLDGSRDKSTRQVQQLTQHCNVHTSLCVCHSLADDAVDGPDVVADVGGSAPAWMNLPLMSHYLRFAIGSYGWPFYVTLTNKLCGLCALCSACRYVLAGVF